jgi:hypothetical protein
MTQSFDFRPSAARLCLNLDPLRRQVAGHSFTALAHDALFP